MAASSGDWEQLLEEVLGKEEGAAVASLLARDIVIDIAGGGEQGHSDGSQVLTERAGSALHVVAAAGDSEPYLQSARVICRRARRLLAAPDGDGDTPLHCATRAGNKGMVARLIELAAEGDEEHGGGGREKVRDLLRMQNARGETALHEAVRFGDRDMVQLLVNKDKELARVVAKDGTSPLYLACSLSHHRIAAKLHDADDELSYSGPNRQNALHAAALQDKGE
jgi:ankyrin repeat protein